MPESWGLPLFIIAVFIFLGGFALGTQRNVRKGDTALKWLRQGLPLVGERTTMRWLGSSVVELKIAKANDPFRSAETLVLFEPRDVIFLWAWARLRGRRDTLIFRSQLRSTPSFELEAFDPNGWTTRGDEREAQHKNWSRLELTAGQGLIAYASDPKVASLVKPMVDMATRGGGRLIKLSVHRAVPNLEITWFLPEAGRFPARELFLSVRQIAEEVEKA